MATTNIYYRGDFKTIVTLANDFTLLPFKFIYTSGKLGIKQYVASYDGTNFTNCRLSDDGKKIVVVFDNHNLAPGPLKVVRVWRATDDDMPDGYFDTQFGADTGILLTTNPADCTPEAEYYERIVVESEELAQIMRGNSAYEVAVKNGYVGTEAQWVASLSAPATTAAASCNATENAVKTAEASRVTAENGRVSAEATRTSNESARQSAEANRVTAEANRVTAESTRTSKETARQSAETARVTAESNRVTAETARANAETTRQANEETRVTAEAARVSAETSRASAESARAATFTTNEATRQTTFNNSEAGRTTTFNTNEATRQATFESKEATRDAANQEALNCATQLAQMQSKVGGLENMVINGGSAEIYDYSSFAASGKCTLTNTISLSNVGDYIEAKAKVSYVSGSAHIIKGASTTPSIAYTGANKIYFRLATTSCTAQNAAYSGAVVVVKMVLASIADGAYKYDCYVNGTKQTTQAVHTSAAVFTQIGGSTSTMDLYYITYKAGGADDVTLTEFSKVGTASGVTDNTQSIPIKGNREIAEEVERLDNLVGSTNMYYTYHKVSTHSGATSDFIVYQRIRGSLFLGVFIIKYHSATKPSDYWRVGISALYNYTGGSMVATAASGANRILTGGESECVLKWMPNATDSTSYNYDSGYSGGFHFGESLTNGFVDFFINGEKKEEPSADVPLTSIASFSYREKSAIYRADTSSIACYHIKETILKDGGYITKNRLDMVDSLDYYAFMGILTVSRNMNLAMAEKNDTITDCSTYTNKELWHSSNHTLMWQSNELGVQAIGTSQIDYGDDDSQNDLYLHAVNGSYNKYYRKTQVKTGNVNNRIQSTTIFKVESL